MAYVDDYQYDLFISYSQANNQRGWVRSFRDQLLVEVNDLLGETDATHVFFDETSVRKAKELTKQIREAAASSAVLLLVGSPAYLQSDWCRQERDEFFKAAGGSEASDGRVFLVLYDELPIRERPDPLQELVGFAFFEMQDGLPATLEPDHEDYRRELNKLRRELAGQLRNMAGQSDLAQPDETPAAAPPAKRPKIKYNPKSKAVALQLDEKQHERMLLDAKHAPSDELTAIDAKILDLKRQLRDGPQLVGGDWLGNRYKLATRLGSGGFATVWQAFDEHTKQVVAVKVLHGQFSDSSERRHRFRRGAQAMQRLTHAHIVPVLQAFSEDEGHCYFVMEYMSGGTLLDAACGKAMSDDEIRVRDRTRFLRRRIGG